MVARQMRHEPTPAEALLWQRLRDRQLSEHRFRRQYAIDRFIVDFVCLKSALIVEVDGAVHQQQVESDQEREEILKALGFRVIRFSNAEVLEQTDQVLGEILYALSQSGLASTFAPTGTPSSFSGFDENGEGAGG